MFTGFVEYRVCGRALDIWGWWRRDDGRLTSGAAIGLKIGCRHADHSGFLRTRAGGRRCLPWMGGRRIT